MEDPTIFSRIENTMGSPGIRLTLKEVLYLSVGDCPSWHIFPGGTGPRTRTEETRTSHGQCGKLHCLTLLRERIKQSHLWRDDQGCSMFYASVSHTCENQKPPWYFLEVYIFGSIPEPWSQNLQGQGRSLRSCICFELKEILTLGKFR